MKSLELENYNKPNFIRINRVEKKLGRILGKNRKNDTLLRLTSPKESSGLSL